MLVMSVVVVSLVLRGPMVRHLLMVIIRVYEKVTGTVIVGMRTLIILLIVVQLVSKSDEKFLIILLLLSINLVVRVVVD